LNKLIFIILLILSHTALAAELIPQGAQFDVGFSPKNGALEIILNGIQNARKEILIASYSFTSKPIATALLNARKRGIKVLLVADQKSNIGKYSAAQFLANQDVPVRLNGNYPIHHHKFMIIDHKHLELGSFNYSAAAANKNAENALLLLNVKPIADIYAREWKRLWDEATPLLKNY